MQFSPELRERVADRSITVTYRLWSRLQVKVGGVYRSGSVRIEVDDIEELPFSAITGADLPATGEADLEALRRRAGPRRPDPRRHAGLQDRVSRRFGLTIDGSPAS